MRTDYKIGIAAVVLLGVVITTWSVLTSGPDEPPARDEQPDQLAAVKNDRDDLDAPAERRVLPHEGGGYRQRDEDRVLEGLTGGGTGGFTDNRIPRNEGEGGSSDWPLGSGQTIEQRDRLEPRGIVNDPTPAATKYTVKENDQGFWAVSEHVYGDGKHWALIAQANPSADSCKLRAGQTLTIPPLPKAPDPPIGRLPGAPGRPTNGQVVAGSDGKRHYYVQEGDSGFWAVSAKAYGNGKYWALIAKANPSVNSLKLKAGQKIIVPPLPTRVTSGGRATGTGAALKPGEKWYTVVEGDAGFWDVAKKEYGSGVHWSVIAKANPSVNARRLQKGQRLVVPPLPASSGRGAATAAAPPRRRISYDGVPNFAMRRFIMGEGGGMPRHTNTVEHEQFVLCGRAEVGIGDDVHQVEPGCVMPGTRT